MLKNKNTQLIALCATLLVGGVVLYFSRTNQPSPRPAIGLPASNTVATDTDPAASNPVPVPAPPSVPPVASKPIDKASSTLVRFSSAAAKQDFMAVNQLEAEEVSHLENLDVYQINRGQASLTAVAGSVTYPNIRYTALAAPNDTNYANQWYAPQVSQPQSWDLTTGSANTTVAVIDTGFALGHVEFANRWHANSGEIGATGSQGPAPNCTSRGLALNKSCNNIDDDANGLNDDWRGWDFEANDSSPQAGEVNANGQSVDHGSLVAGLIGATGNNAAGIAGANWSAKLLPLQALDDNGVGYTDSVASAVRYSVDQGAKVINLSLGAGSEDLLLKYEIDRAIAAGVIVVAAAGNTNCNCLLYPANYPNVIAVGASDSNDNRASWASYGANLDLVAPGVNICSTDWSAGNQTSLISCGHAGSSFSAPIVSGAVSLMLARAPSLTANNIEQLLARSSTSASAYSIYTGYGRLDTLQAVLAASLSASAGQVVNKHTAYLGSSGSLSLGPLMNSTCHTLPEASCEIRLTGPSGQVISLGVKPADEFGVANFYWNAQTLGLATGSWRIDAIAIYNGQTTTQTDYVTVNP